MTYTRLPWRVRSIASRARAEAYAGLLLLVLGLMVLAFWQCPYSNGSQRPRPVGVSLRVSRGKLPSSVDYGNALSDGSSRKGWWVGHFMQTDSARYSSQVETKWITHPKDKKHDGFSTNKIATSMAVLISGKHRIEFEDSYVLLEHPGDYVIWGPGVPHSWLAIEESTMLCIRWPSINGDQVHSSVNVSVHASTALLKDRRPDEPRLSIQVPRNTSKGPNGRLQAA